MKILSIPSTAFVLRNVKPQEDNSKRLVAFKEFYDADDTDQLLRRIALALRLTQHATSITAKKAGEEPALVRLGRGVVQRRTSEELRDILALAHADPKLNLTATVSCLFRTQARLCIRFRIYNEYPYCLWKLTHKYNAGQHVAEVEASLETPEEPSLGICG